jgi:hypothetical protein
MKPTFNLEKAKAVLHFTPRRELHGEDPKPAATIALDLTLPLSALAMFAPSLRSSFYHNPNKPVNGGASPIDDANDLRYPQVKNALKWELEITGGELTVHYGIGGKSDIVLPIAKADAFELECKQSEFRLGFRVACHPDEGQSGALAMMQDTAREVSFESPHVEDLAEQGGGKKSDARKKAAEATT